MAIAFAPLIVLSVPQIVARWNLDADEFEQVMALLTEKQRKLTSGKPAYFATDVEEAMREVRTRG